MCFHNNCNDTNSIFHNSNSKILNVGHVKREGERMMPEDFYLMYPKALNRVSICFLCWSERTFFNPTVCQR